jgi:intracellular sulfur oxidation DsrE/DsrF family protein
MGHPLGHVLVFIATISMAFGFLQDDKSAAQQEAVISDFGATLPVKTDVAINSDTKFKLRFDVSEKAKPGSINQTLDLAARFINLHVAAGIPLDNIDIAIVVHGTAATDMTQPGYYKTFNKDRDNASAAAIATLQKNNVKFYLCGQSAAAQGISNADLLPGVKMALSAMTMHALLDQKGYSLNPF